MDIGDRERFWRHVQRTEACWLWLGYIDRDGYGRATRFIEGTQMAHRVAYVWEFGSIPNGMTLDHLCRVRSCVRPLHLEPVTNAENLLRGEGLSVQNAAKTNCPIGHRYDDVNTYMWRGERSCKECRRLRTRDANRKRRAKAMQIGEPKRIVEVPEPEPIELPKPEPAEPVPA